MSAVKDQLEHLLKHLTSDKVQLITCRADVKQNMRSVYKDSGEVLHDATRDLVLTVSYRVIGKEEDLLALNNHAGK